MKIICIYNASSTLTGELNYLYKKIFQNESCGMCDISHNLTGMKKEWKEMEAQSDHDYSLLHIDEVPKNIPRNLIQELPCVIQQHEESCNLLITHEELNSCKGNIKTFTTLLDYKLNELLNQKKVKK
ncbi:MAG: hypothetical protein HOL62_03310 [Candidatus Marinimicrobia bacterium]|jgi:hypothetical protein|nr:hypothetical protein [Candidatus Neomarinimicrobiota bacterium]MBT3944758.1 hypothetical protein [Candidatus Neomarinimicrobiota bacterium]MBT4925910.1 hypothetical protein [Candidatus Neomarinimicrobiota bacterium]MBT5251714.1 hypothetical protein [Candidatus Neomarinimicrobiota bacterium]MBT5490128.1 hypothetical protein [Candidatus Neomarinimicrobiota bacterium]